MQAMRPLGSTEERRQHDAGALAEQRGQVPQQGVGAIVQEQRDGPLRLRAQPRLSQGQLIEQLRIGVAVFDAPYRATLRLAPGMLFQELAEPAGIRPHYRSPLQQRETQALEDAPTLQLGMAVLDVPGEHLRALLVVGAPVAARVVQALGIGAAQHHGLEPEAVEAVDQGGGAGERHPAQASCRQEPGHGDDQQPCATGRQRREIADLDQGRPGHLPTRGASAASIGSSRYCSRNSCPVLARRMPTAASRCPGRRRGRSSPAGSAGYPHHAPA